MSFFSRISDVFENFFFFFKKKGVLLMVLIFIYLLKLYFYAKFDGPRHTISTVYSIQKF